MSEWYSECGRNTEQSNYITDYLTSHRTQILMLSSPLLSPPLPSSPLPSPKPPHRQTLMRGATLYSRHNGAHATVLTVPTVRVREEKHIPHPCHNAKDNSPTQFRTVLPWMEGTTFLLPAEKLECHVHNAITRMTQDTCLLVLDFQHALTSQSL